MIFATFLLTIKLLVQYFTLVAVVILLVKYTSLIFQRANHYFTVEPDVYYVTSPDYQGVLIFQVSLHDNVSFGTIARCVDYAGVHIFKCPD